MLGFVLLGVFSLLLAIRLLHLASQAASPTLHYKLCAFNRSVINSCPLLTKCYVPPLLWGKSGHLQTVIYAKLGRVKSPFPKGQRVSMVMPDGATMTFDIFEPHKPHPSGEDYTLVLCPGIANSSESLYIRTCVDYAQNAGYRMSVLNHIGAVKNEPLTAPRIFTYGDTDEYGMMVNRVIEMYPQSKLMAVGFSMGGNVVIKYLGENMENRDKFIGAMSFCQGYDAATAAEYLIRWEHMRRGYLWAMTQHQKSLLRSHGDILLSPEILAKHNLDLDAIFQSQTLLDLDEAYSRRRAGFDSVWDYYEWASCKKYIQNITNIPTLIVNTLDDPIVPNELHDTPKEFAMNNDKVIFATLQHGGHLGFFEGGLVVPETITWLDKIVVQYADAVAMTMIKTS